MTFAARVGLEDCKDVLQDFFDGYVDDHVELTSQRRRRCGEARVS